MNLVIKAAITEGCAVKILYLLLPNLVGLYMCNYHSSPFHNLFYLLVDREMDFFFLTVVEKCNSDEKGRL